MIDYYKILGVAYDDPPQKIRARYRLLAMTTHPDHAPQSDTESFTHFTEAYHRLIQPELRLQHNRELGIYAPPRSLHPGHDLYQRLNVTPEIAHQGGIVNLTFTRYEPCSLCWLAGCHRCEQQGMIPEQINVEVLIQPDTARNTVVFLEGQGGCSEPGGSRGDLFVYISIEAHSIENQ